MRQQTGCRACILLQSKNTCGYYRGIGEKVSTFGIKATLLTSSQIPEHVIYQFTKAAFENLEEFKELSEKDMVEGMGPPLHTGVLEYFKEKGWK